MSPRLEFLGYFVVLLVGVSAYLFESHMSRLGLMVVVAGHLVVLRYLCRQLARRFKYDEERKKAA
jgi:hypothetical protein